MNDNETNMQVEKKPKKPATLKIILIVLLAYLSIFPVMYIGITYDIQFIYYIYCCLIVLLVCYAVRKKAIAGGKKNAFKLWWLPAVIMAVILAFITIPELRLTTGSKYQQAEETFDSWVDTDPNTWTEAQTEYFNDVMNYNAD